MEYPLERTWTLWETLRGRVDQRHEIYRNNTKALGEFSTLHEFWQYWHYIDHSDPHYLFSKIFTEEAASVEAVCIFEQGIEPAWEDPVNVEGCDISVRKKFDPQKLKEFWNKLVFSIIGETLPFSEEVAGCRIVDKVPFYKVELWWKTDLSDESNTEKRLKVEQALLGVFDFKIESKELRVSNHKQ